MSGGSSAICEHNSLGFGVQGVYEGSRFSFFLVFARKVTGQNNLLRVQLEILALGACGSTFKVNVKTDTIMEIKIFRTRFNSHHLSICIHIYIYM